MTSKQRVHAALRREPVDRVPVFMWFHPETIARLGRLLEIPPAYVDEVMGNDIKMTWVNNNYAMEGIVHEHDGESHVDFWGVEWAKDGPFNQISRYPLAEASVSQMLQYAFPWQHMEALLGRMEPLLASRQDYFIGCDVSPCVFEMYWRLRGMDRALLDMAAEPEMTETLFGRCADFAVMLSEEACRRFPLDWLWTGDDVASQQSLMMSPAMWRRLIKPQLQRVFEVGRRHKLWVAYHCCGTLRPIIPDLIEMGLDVLNPIQCNCPGMEAGDLKREFGKQLAFMGGVDTQELLPKGSANEVRRATRCLLDVMTADGGGYILAASHTIPPETPIENIFAMYAEAGLSREAIFDHAASLRARLGKAPGHPAAIALASVSRKDLVNQAITFRSPARVPVVFWNRDQTEGEVMIYHLALGKPGDGTVNAWDWTENEWGYRLESPGDGTMGHPTKPFYPELPAPGEIRIPALRAEERFSALPAFLQSCGDRYRLASFDLSGFTVYTLLRGFENAMQDFLLEPERFAALQDRIMDFECDLMRQAAKHGFHGIHFADDWGTQSGLMISPSLWRSLFKPRYARQFALARTLGLHTWFHCCGNFAEIVEDFHEIGADVINISQPNVVDLQAVAARLRGKQCFLLPISYQTVSIKGTPADIQAEARRLYGLLGAPKGGFIGYVEEYGVMGMSQENYRACGQAFRALSASCAASVHQDSQSRFSQIRVTP